MNRAVPVALALLLAADAAAEEPDEEDRPRPPRPEVTFDWGGHVKSFGLVSLPQRTKGLPDDALHHLLDPFPRHAQGAGILDGRLTLTLGVGDVFQMEAAHAITTFVDSDAGQDRFAAAVADPLLAGDLEALSDLTRLGNLLDADDASGLAGLSGAGAGGVFQTGVGLTAPEAFPLTWNVGRDPARDVRLQGRTDRLTLRFTPERATITLGRQPISFGAGLFFTPLDLVAPFTPATIDSEYKPGLDAIRVDGFFGMSGQLTVLAAYTGSTYLHEAPAEGETNAQRVSAAAYGQYTVGVTDLGLLYSFNRGDHVVGLTVVSSAGPVGLHGDAAVTVPRPDLDEPVFFRGVVGITGRPTGTTTLTGEVYVQSFGSTDPAALFDTLGGERAMRGEVWLAGLAYAGFSVSQEITPLLITNVGVLANLTDPSFLLTPSVSWSISENADAVFGGFVGLGARPKGSALDLDALEAQDTVAPEDLVVATPRSEFGSYPATLFLQVRAYF